MNPEKIVAVLNIRKHRLAEWAQYESPPGCIWLLGYSNGNPDVFLTLFEASAVADAYLAMDNPLEWPAIEPNFAK